ncbi:MAG: redoxin domain-containing protein [Candidatus Dormibacteraeota bacterium]|nr:redoxin domain-containing protein [Candidatus Dormibacteraeota bacterium]
MIGALGLAFAAGLVSCMSTCFLPLLPAYVTFMGGRTAATAGEPALRHQLRVLKNALLFIAGFTTIFVIFGAAAGLVGADLLAFRPLLLRIAGIALVLMGIALIGALPWLMREFRFEVAHRLPKTPWAPFVVGLAFAVGWTPCIGPILAAILIAAADSATAGRGALLLLAYSAGMAIPLLLAAGLAGRLVQLLRRFAGVSIILNRLAAGFLIVFGVLIFSNQLTVLNSLFPYVSPPFQDGLSAPNLHPSGASARGNGVLRVGKPAPPFRVTDIDGHQLSLADLRGKPVLVNFWATWCTPCREELPMIVSAYRAHRGQGFTVVAIDYKESPEVVKKFWEGLNLEPTPFVDPDGRTAAAYGVGLSTSGLPVSVFIARDGTVSAFSPWQLDPDTLAQQLKAIL